MKDIEITKEYKEVLEKEITIIKCKIKDGDETEKLSIQEYESYDTESSKHTKKVDAKGVRTPQNYFKLIELIKELLK